MKGNKSNAISITVAHIFTCGKRFTLAIAIFMISAISRSVAMEFCYATPSRIMRMRVLGNMIDSHGAMRVRVCRAINILVSDAATITIAISGMVKKRVRAL